MSSGGALFSSGESEAYSRCNASPLHDNPLYDTTLHSWGQFIVGGNSHRKNGKAGGNPHRTQDEAVTFPHYSSRSEISATYVRSPIIINT